jgi:GTP-binding nuclear protein Ran
MVHKDFYKVCLIGDGGVGKTTYINRVLDGKFEKNYHATIGVATHQLTFHTSPTQKIQFRVWDTAGQEKWALLGDMYYIDADAAIFFFDVTSRVTCSNLPRWIKNFNSIVDQDGKGNIPIVVCANKIDVQRLRKVTRNTLSETLKMYPNFEYVEISAKTAHNFALPFLCIARKLLGDPNLIFVSDLNLEPTNIDYSIVAEEKNEVYEELMHKAAYMAPEGE